jgi:hypothetical protein
MKYFDWSAEKNEQLKMERGVSFEDIVVAINEGKILDILMHKNQKKYPGQRLFVIQIDHYAYTVPFIEDDEKIFLKTIFASRKATKHYIINA